MATLASDQESSAETRERGFFLVMTIVISVLTVAGFAANVAQGRAVPNPPIIFHIHALAYLGWLVLAITQAALAYRNDLRLHRVVGTIALAWLPVLVVLALAMTIASLRLHGGPPVLGVAEFLFVNTMHVVSFAALTGVAVALWRRTDWHRRLMLCGLASIGAPGIARLLPLPLFVPYVFPVLFAAAMLFPVIALVVDMRRTGRVHPAWLWGIGSVCAMLIVGEAMAMSSWGQDVAAGLVAGTPGADRPQWGFAPGA
jgi:hypothetical protein